MSLISSHARASEGGDIMYNTQHRMRMHGRLSCIFMFLVFCKVSRSSSVRLVENAKSAWLKRSKGRDRVESTKISRCFLNPSKARI